MSSPDNSQSVANAPLLVLVVLGVLFLVVQGAALFWGVALARSITYAVHELFVGTERVQQGDFAHRIRIDSGDQLGDLASPFNRMSASIEHLLHVQREKQRLDDELRIAREIQKSLLPGRAAAPAGRQHRGSLRTGARSGRRLLRLLRPRPAPAGRPGRGRVRQGHVGGALYMAELKGLMLALSHNERSPRRLLIDVNRRLAEHLDNRSFITMTYLVLDLDARTLTCARAGHTPLIVVSGGRSEVMMPSGMVLGLRLPGAAERFEELLEEHTRPIHAGDVIVLYTDGITEAMDGTASCSATTPWRAWSLSHRHLDAAGIRERVVREVKAFVGDAEPHDDMTMVILKFEPEGPAAAA